MDSVDLDPLLSRRPMATSTVRTGCDAQPRPRVGPAPGARSVVRVDELREGLYEVLVTDGLRD
jgi:hypothetical protein